MPQFCEGPMVQDNWRPAEDGADVVECPECRRHLRVPSTMLGRLVKCPACGATFHAIQVPEAPTPPPRPGLAEDADNIVSKGPLPDQPLKGLGEDLWRDA